MIIGNYTVILYFTHEVFRCLANQIHQHIPVMLEFVFVGLFSLKLSPIVHCTLDVELMDECKPANLVTAGGVTLDLIKGTAINVFKGIFHSLRIWDQ